VGSAVRLQDWRIDEDRRLIYYLDDNRSIWRLDISNVLPTKRTGQATDLPFRIKYEFDQDKTYGSGDTYAVPYEKYGHTYVPVDCLLKALNLRGEIGKDFKKTDQLYIIPVINPLTSLETKVVAEVIPRDGYYFFYVQIDDFLNKVYEITGQGYKWSYDAPTNILYLQPEAQTLPLFNWWW